MKRHEDGYVLFGIAIGLVILGIAMTAAVPLWQKIVQREREKARLEEEARLEAERQQALREQEAADRRRRQEDDKIQERDTRDPRAEQEDVSASLGFILGANASFPQLIEQYSMGDPGMIEAFIGRILVSRVLPLEEIDERSAGVALERKKSAHSLVFIPRFPSMVMAAWNQDSGVGRSKVFLFR